LPCAGAPEDIGLANRHRNPFSGTGRRRLGAAVALVAVIAVVIAVVFSSGSSPSSPAAASAASLSGAATVQRRNLVQTDTESGTLSYAEPQTVYDRLTGTITWLPNVGQLIRTGGTLFKVDGEPVILMSGTLPAYRDLSAADSDGSDVLELNRNLVALGFNADAITVDDIWQPATTLGVELLQESLGETPTGSLSLGQVVFLPGDQLVSAVDGTLGATGSGGGSSAAAASTRVDPPAPEFVSLQTTRAGSNIPTTPTARAATARRPKHHANKKHGHRPKRSRSSKQTLAALIALLKAQIAELKANRSADHGTTGSGSKSSSPSRSSSASTGGGSTSASNSGGTSGSGASAQAILQTTSTKLVVTVDLNASVQSEAKVGEHVTVQMPAGNTVNAKVTAVSRVAQSSSGSGSAGGGSGASSGGGGGGGGSGSSSSTIPVTVTLSGHHTGAGLDQAAVSVTFAQQRANNVLSVPVTALVATSGASYAVQEAAAPHRLIPVTTGLFAAGYVQISGPGVYPGLQVTDSQG